MVTRTRRALSEPRFYPRRIALAGTVGYRILFALGVAYAAAFVRATSFLTPDGGRDLSTSYLQPRLAGVWLVLLLAHAEFVNGANARVRSVVVSGLMAGYLGKGRMGPEVKNAKKGYFKIYFWLTSALLAIIAIGILFLYHPWSG